MRAKGKNKMNSITKEIIKATNELNRIKNEQSYLMYSAVFSILWQDYQWRENRIMRRLADSIDVMRQGIQDDQSIFEVLEAETGIELTLDGKKSYHEYAFLSRDTQLKPINDFQYLHMIRHEQEWIPSVLIGAICIVLHRQDKWGFNRLSTFVNRVNILRNSLGENKKLYSDYMYEITGHRPEEMWKESN